LIELRILNNDTVLELHPFLDGGSSIEIDGYPNQQVGGYDLGNIGGDALSLLMHCMHARMLRSVILSSTKDPRVTGVRSHSRKIKELG